MDSSQSDWKSTITHWEQNVVQAIDPLLLLLACPGGVGMVRNQDKAFVLGRFNLVDYFRCAEYYPRLVGGSVRWEWKVKERGTSKHSIECM